jgi:EmrB/QacA subfamily drug resistance transporter
MDSAALSFGMASITFVRTPCDQNIVNAAPAESVCGINARKWVLAATILGSSMAFIDSTAVNVALPALQVGLHASVVDVQWVVESYGLLLGALILVGGSLGDHFGRRATFVTGVGIFASASAACGFAANVHQLILARSVQGIGAALLVPGSLAIITACFDQESRGQAIGTWSAFTAITTAVGPVLGGWLVEQGSWRLVFFINIPLAAAVIAMSLCQIPESRSQNSTRIDWAGAVFATVGLSCLVFGLIESSNLGWRSPSVIGSIVIGLGTLVGFVYAEKRVGAPMVPLSLFASPSFSGANLVTLSLYAALGIFFFLLPLNLIQVQKYSATESGAALLPVILLMFLLSRWSGGLVARYGPRIPLVIGPLLAALGFALLAIPSLRASYWRSFLPALLILGFGMAVTVAPLTTVVMNSADPDRAGAASGINNAIARIAGVMAVAVLGIVMVRAFVYRLDSDLVHDPLPLSDLQQIRNNATKLGALQAPHGLGPEQAATVNEVIAQSFVFGFRIVVCLCAGLAACSAAIAWRLIQLPPSFVQESPR